MHWAQPCTGHHRALGITVRVKLHWRCIFPANALGLQFCGHLSFDAVPLLSRSFHHVLHRVDVQRCPESTTKSQWSLHVLSFRKINPPLPCTVDRDCRCLHTVTDLTHFMTVFVVKILQVSLSFMLAKELQLSEVCLTGMPQQSESGCTLVQ